MTRSSEQRSVRNFLVRGLLPGGRDPQQGTIPPSLAPIRHLELLERYPKLFRLAFESPYVSREPFAFDGICVGDGWFGIVDLLAAKLATDPRLVAAQVKQKNGELRFYVCGELRPEHEQAVEEARRESKHTCETCGKRGKARMIGGWLTVCCLPCYHLAETGIERRARSRRCGPS